MKDIPLHPFIAAFRDAVIRQLNSAEAGEALPPMPQHDLVVWRQAWVRVFCDLCEPLYRFICLPDSEFNGHSLNYHIYISENEVMATRYFFEQFCSGTPMNHLLDSDVASFVLPDYLAAFASLVEHIVGQPIRESFQFSRITSTRLLLSQIVFWQGG